MAKARTASYESESERAAASQDYSALFQANGAAVAAAIKSSEAMLHGLAEMNREMMSFAGDRLRKSFETSESLMGCQDPAQAFSLQCEHAHRATQAYLEEATRLMNLAAKMSEECLQPIELQTREALTQVGKTRQPGAR